MARAAFNRKKNLFTSKLDLNLENKLAKCYMWSITLYGDETWTLWKVLSFEEGWRRSVGLIV
jgi:hypothetical protein